MYYRAIWSVDPLRQFMKELCFFWNLEYRKYTVFSVFPVCSDILSWNFAHDFVLMYFRASSSAITLRQFLKELCLFVNLEYRKNAVFRTFLFNTCFEMLSWNFVHDFVLMYYRSNSSVITLHPSGSPSVHHFLEPASYMHWQLSWNFRFDFGFFNAFLLEKRYIKKKPFKMFMTGVLCTVCGAQIYLSIYRMENTASVPFRNWSLWINA